MSTLASSSEFAPAAALRDALLMASRGIRHHARVPSLVVFSLMTPVLFLLLFRYVLGGSIAIQGISYADFLVPGVLVLSIAFGATQTGVGLSVDVGRGVTDRFRSLPISRSAVVAGRILVDTARNALLTAVILVLGLAIGFRFGGSAGEVALAFVIALAFAFAFSWVAAFVGLTVRHAEAVHDAGFVWVVPLTFASSTLVAVDSMPAAVRWFARINPVTSVADAVRDLLLGAPAGTALLRATAWNTALVIVFAPLAVRAYQRR